MIGTLRPTSRSLFASVVGFIATQFLAVLVALTSSYAHDQTAEKQFDWSDEFVGVDSAEGIVRECLIADEYPRNPHKCIRLPYTICTAQMEGGRKSQLNLNRCAGFARRGWTRVLQEVYKEVLDVVENGDQIIASQARWKSWSDSDCDPATRAAEGGSIRPLLYSMCEINHAAARTLDLIYILSIQQVSTDFLRQ